MYLEDYLAGHEFILSPVSLSEDEIIAFSKKYDPLRMHTDKEFAKNGVFGGIIASGVHSLIAVWGKFLEQGGLGDEVIAGMEVDKLKWFAPVRPGDTLFGVVKVLSARPIKKQGCGIVKFALAARNQNGETVLSSTTTVMVRRRGS